MMTGTPQLTEYGMTTDVFVNRKPHGEAIVIGGAGEQDKWTRVLSRRAAHLLWIQLTKMLFPDKAHMVMALAATTPLRSPDAPTITSEVAAATTPDGLVEISGTAGARNWAARLHAEDARRLWMALDIALYPVGWEGQRVVHRHQ